MRAARLHAPRDLRLDDEPVPDPSPGDVLLRVTAVGLCGSDRHWFLEGGIGGTSSERPLVLGHEIAAVVAGGRDAGMRVVLEPAIPCDRCSTCRAGDLELCPSGSFAGFGETDGGLRTYMTWPRHLLHPIPPNVDDENAALLEALAVAVHAVHLAGVDPSSRVAVIGCGPIGLLAVRVLRVRGITAITAIEPLAHRAAAVAAGAEADARAAGASDQPIDAVIECAGPDEAVALAVDLVRPGGRVVIVGIPASDQTSVPASVARRKGIAMQWCRRTRRSDFAEAIDLLASGRIEVGSLISHRFSLEDVTDAFRVLADQRGLKVIVQP